MQADKFLRGVDNGLDQDPPVKLFVMGANVWRDEADWPLPDTRFTPYYLHSSGSAGSDLADGRLSVEPPADDPDASIIPVEDAFGVVYA